MTGNAQDSIPLSFPFHQVMDVAVSLRNSSTLQLIKDALKDAKSHERYTLARPANEETKARVTRIRETLQKIELAYDSEFQRLLRQVKDDVQSELDILRRQNDEHIATISRLKIQVQILTEQNKQLRATVKKLESVCYEFSKERDEFKTEMEQSKKERDEFKETMEQSKRERDEFKEAMDQFKEERDAANQALSKFKHSTLRRQIAINIEHEFKLQLMNHFGEDVEEPEDIQRKSFSELKRQVMSTMNPALSQLLKDWIGGTSSDHWVKFRNAMQYMKAFSAEYAHPVALDEASVDLCTALDLISEPFSVGSVTKQKYDWNAVKNIVKRQVRHLALNCRDQNESLLHTFAI